MDINSSALQKSEKLIIFTDEFALNFPTKSFRCTFCKRGFSNAQALGGHMNIHRKDRAKLREFSNENLLSLEISKNADWEEDSSLGEKFSLENDRSPDGDQVESRKYPPRRLPSRPLVDGGEVSVGFLSKHADSRKEKLKYGELDLELRLGPEPHHSANSK